MKTKAKRNEVSDISSRLYHVQNGDLVAMMKRLVAEGERHRQRFMRQIAIVREQPAKDRMPKFYGAGEDGGVPYFIMEDVTPIPEHLPLTEAVAVVRDVAEACLMLRSHRDEYFHCGIHWEHIGRRSDGRAILLAFGRAFTKVQALVAPSTIDRPYYLAPEALAEGWITEKAEIYALGRLLADLLDGKVPSDVAPVIADATAERPEERIGSLPELIVRLNNLSAIARVGC